jgi:hypothetical protein
MLVKNISAVLGSESLEADGKKFDAAAIEALFAKRTAATQQADSLHEAYQQAVKAEREALAATHDDVKLVYAALRLKFRSAGDVLAKLGLPPVKKQPKPLTVGAKAAKVAKAKATRDGHQAKAAPSPPAAVPPKTGP